MLDYLREMLRGDTYAPHGYCLLWQPELVWTHVVADALIAAAYFSIPVALVWFVRRRPDMQFGWVFWCFATFILACGTTHVLGIWNLWNAHYALEAGVKAVTAAASVATAILVWPLVPRALAIPGPAALQSANEQLTASLLARDTAYAKLEAEIAERKQTEAKLLQAQKIEALGQLTSGIAHDFNNLLQAIGGNVQLIERSPEKTERVQRWAAMSREAVDRAARLTSQLLAFSRVQSLAVVPTGVGALVNGMAEMLRRTLGPAVALEIRIVDDAVVRADPTQLELAILNLAINARDAMPAGGRLVISAAMRDVSGHPDLANGRYAEIAVADTGTGMPADVANRAFDPFFTTKPPGKGTGLGLSTVYGFARQLGGTAEIESVLGAGTTIRVLLRSDDSRAAPGTEVTDLHRLPDLSGCRVLVVDDDPHVRAGLVDSIETMAAEVWVAESGAQGLERLAAGSFDLVIADYAMPGMTGAEFAAAARARGCATPILYVSGFADIDAIVAATGADSVILKKPFTLHTLATAVRRVVPVCAG